MNMPTREQVIRLLEKHHLGSPIIGQQMMDWLRLFYTYARADLETALADQRAQHKITYDAYVKEQEKGDDLRTTLQAAYDAAVDHDDRLPFDWAVYCEMLHHALKPK